MAQRTGVGLRHAVRELRGGFVLRPGVITLAMAALAIGLSKLEERITSIQGWSEFLDRVFPPEPQAAYVVLGTIGGSMITVVSVVYSILLVVLTFASTQFSPRVLVTFVEDRVSQTTLGIFVGTFTELAGAIRHAPYAEAIVEQARRLAAACASGFPDANRAELNDRLATVERAAAGAAVYDAESIIASQLATEGCD